MGYKCFDYLCEECNYIKEDVVVADGEIVDCDMCNAFMTRLMPSVGLINPHKPGTFTGEKGTDRRMR